MRMTIVYNCERSAPASAAKLGKKPVQVSTQKSEFFVIEEHLERTW